MISVMIDSHTPKPANGCKDLQLTDFLYDDRTGLPQSYEPDEVDVKAQAVFAHTLTRRGPDFHAA